MSVFFNFNPRPHMLPNKPFLNPANPVPRKPDFLINSNKFNTTKVLSPFSISADNLRSCHCYNSNSQSLGEVQSFLASDATSSEEERQEGGSRNVWEFLEVLRSWGTLVRSLLPGGSWWNICDFDSKELDGTTEKAEPVTVLHALHCMWTLFEDDRWVLYTAFGSLTIAALSKISIPNILAASIFSAQSRETVVFYSNSRRLVFLCLSAGICSGLQSGCFGIANVILLKRLRETLYSALLMQDLSFFDKEVVGDLTSRLGADIQRLSRAIEYDLHMILRSIIQGTGALINLLTLSWPLALSALVICYILSAIFLAYGQYQKRAAKITQEIAACANEAAQETFSLMRTVRAYGTERKELERYKHWLYKIAFIGERESVSYGFWNLSFSTLYRATQVLAILFGGVFTMTGCTSPEQLTKYILYCEWLIYAAWRLQDNMSSLLQSIGASEKALKLMDLLPSNQFLKQGVKLQRLEGSLDFVDVSFHYPSRNLVPLLEHVNLHIQANEVTAIVGHSGCGKSTLMKLLLRLYEPTGGQIMIDGFPLEDLDIQLLRGKMGYVGQEPHLFHMDVKSNISYGCSREFTWEDVEWAAKQAYAHEFIISLPNGYGTIVDDNLLSGGQKQRIAIARAILRDPAILILDEAFSALDAESEHYAKGLIHAFKNETRAKRTVIVITHRLSTIKAADKILVMDSGGIVEIGDHGELIRKNGLYARLLRIQTNALT